MAISLSNHENRIKALENKGTWITLFNNDEGHIPTDNKSIINLESPINSYHFLMFEFCLSGTRPGTESFFQAIYNGFDFHIGMSKRHYNLTPVWNDGGFWLDIIVKPYDTKIEIVNAGSVYYQYIRCIKGLKLYYNFSYNIYALVVSISKSFLKCLIKIRN